MEVFGGAGWILLAKDAATSRSEVFNDLDGELVNFWRVVKHRPAEFCEAASWLLCSRELFSEWKTLKDIGDEIVRAVRFYAVIRTAFGAKRTHNHFGMRRTERPALYWPTLREEVAKVVERMRRVWIERLPWEPLLDYFDGKKTFFYLDPPYPGTASHSYKHNMDDDAHARLAERLRSRTTGKWLLSYGRNPLIEKLYKGCKIERLSVRYGLQGGLAAPTEELLISNY